MAFIPKHSYFRCANYIPSSVTVQCVTGAYNFTSVGGTGYSSTHQVDPNVQYIHLHGLDGTFSFSTLRSQV